MSEHEKIMDHEFENGFCRKCGRARADLVSYGNPDVVIVVGQPGLSCSGNSTTTEVESLREAYRRDVEKYGSHIRS